MPRDKPSYIPHLVNLMNFFHSPSPRYNRSTNFIRTQLIELNPTVVKHWLAFKAYGKEVYDPEKDEPKKQRANSLEFAKKAVSYFMPNKNEWVNGFGNPTKHSSVHQVIAHVRKAEARRRGAESKAKRPLTEKEFRKTLEIFRSKNDFVNQIKLPAMCLWQFSLIARNDDICHFLVDDPKGHPDYNFALKTKVRWSKNITEERNCPDQILLGSIDDSMCMLLQLAIYLESYLSIYPNARLLFTEDTSERAVSRLKNRYRDNLKKNCLEL